MSLHLDVEFVTLTEEYRNRTVPVAVMDHAMRPPVGSRASVFLTLYSPLSFLYLQNSLFLTQMPSIGNGGNGKAKESPLDM